MSYRPIIILLICLAVSHSASAKTVFVNELCYTLNDEGKTATVTSPLSYSGEADDYFVRYKDEVYAEYLRQTSVDIPAQITYNGEIYRVTDIGTEAFERCNRLRSVTIPMSVTVIKNFAFMECEELGEIVLPESVEEIGSVAFGGCYNLHSVTLPASIWDIGAGAFIYCDNLQVVTCLAKTPPILGDVFMNPSEDPEVFSHRDGTYPDTLYVPKYSVRAYKRSKQWKRFKYILPIVPVSASGKK